MGTANPGRDDEWKFQAHSLVPVGGPLAYSVVAGVSLMVAAVLVCSLYVFAVGLRHARESVAKRAILAILLLLTIGSLNRYDGIWRGLFFRPIADGAHPVPLSMMALLFVAVAVVIAQSWMFTRMHSGTDGDSKDGAKEDE